MKRLILVVILFSIVAISIFCCSTQKPATQTPHVYREEFDAKRQEHRDWLSGKWQAKEEQDKGRAMELELRGLDKKKVDRFDEIKRSVTNRGYLTVGEFQELISMPYWNELGNFLTKILMEDLHPFKAMFFLAIEKENYDEAELVRRAWILNLNKLMNFLEIESVKSRIQLQIDKLKIVGLTDPMLIKLRKELVTAIDNKKWDDAQNIQSIIASRTEELRPKEPQVVEKIREKQAAESTTTQVIVTQPDTQRIEVENIPRYGVTDYGRALSIIGGKPMSSKDTATLKLFDMLMGR